MLNTPWYDYEIPFEDAAEIGTRKVITDHSTIGLVITTDGSITGIERDEYLEAEERVIDELKSINKPFIVVLNTRYPNSSEVKKIQRELEEKHNVTVQVMDVANMDEEDIEDVLNHVLREFPVKEINIEMPSWVEQLEPEHWLKKDFFKILKGMCENISKVRDIKSTINLLNQEENLAPTEMSAVDLGLGKATISMKPKDGIFYNILSEICDLDVKCESDLLSLVKELNYARKNMIR